jgi:uncharacterized membrane protein
VKYKKGKNEMVFDRFLSKFSVVDLKTTKKVFITTGEKKIEIGSFLNEVDKDKLIDLLKVKVGKLNLS